MLSRAIVFREPGKLELIDIPVPELQPGEILVRVRLCTLCASDLHSFFGRRTVPMPSILGHETVGEIVAFADDVPPRDANQERLAVGDRVVWSVAVSCGECHLCSHDVPQKCEKLFKFGHQMLTRERPLSGGLADYCVLPAGSALVRVPESLSDTIAAPLGCTMATVAAVMEAAGDCVGQRILIYGAGPLGVIACALARKELASEVIACDPRTERLEQARRFGATHGYSPEQLPAQLYDAALELSGSADAVESALQRVRPGGRIILAGSVMPTRSVAVDPEQVVRRILTIRGVHNYAPRHLVEAVNFAQECQESTPLSELVGEIFPLEQASEAFARANERQGVRVGVGMVANERK
jgi:putative phosphonate catabolism associated alcohol dehydrogenase